MAKSTTKVQKRKGASSKKGQSEVRSNIKKASLQTMQSPITEPPGAYDRLLLRRWVNGYPATGRDLTRLRNKGYVLPDGEGHILAPGVQQFLPRPVDRRVVNDEGERIAPGLETNVKETQTEIDDFDPPEDPEPDSIRIQTSDDLEVINGRSNQNQERQPAHRLQSVGNLPPTGEETGAGETTIEGDTVGNETGQGETTGDPNLENTEPV